MNKKFIYYFAAVLVIGSLPIAGKVLRTHFAPKEIASLCALDTKICPDGRVVIRELPSCEFKACVEAITVATSSQTQETSATTTELSTSTKIASAAKPPETNTPKVVTQETEKKIPAQETKISTQTIVSKITSVVSSIAKVVTEPFKASPPLPPITNDAAIPASSYITSSSTQGSDTVYKPLPPTDFAGQKYLVIDNNILSNDNKVIYTIPPEVIAAVSSPNAGWTNTTINVVPIGKEPPVINGIPVKDLPGKYYLSENSFGNIEACEFSNKIFILDIYTNEVTLMYEENSSTLSHDDPRACNSEIFLLATDGDKLALKYHTIGTNTLCDSAWSEPDKTFYLDVKKLQTVGMTRYTIPENLSGVAEQEEEACRAKL